MKQIPLRLPDELVDLIDERAARFGMSRNAWCEKALRYVVELPARSETVTQTKRF